MGAQFSQAISQIAITTNTIAYPQQQKKKEKQQNTKQKGYNIFSNYGTKNISFDYTSFGKKSFYKEDATDIQIKDHLKKLQQKQVMLKKYKFYQDFDRIDNRKGQIAPLHSYFQKCCVHYVLLCLVMGRIAANFTNHCYISTAISCKTITKFFFGLFLLPFYLAFRSQLAQPVNQEYFKNMPHQVRMYQLADYELNAYKYVDDIKYNFKYPSQQEYMSIKTIINQNVINQPYFDAVNYYKRKYGIIEVPNFQINSSEKQKNA